MTTYRLLTPIFLALRQHIEFWPPFFGAHRLLSPWVPGSLPTTFNEGVPVFSLPLVIVSLRIEHWCFIFRWTCSPNVNTKQILGQVWQCHVYVALKQLSEATMEPAVEKAGDACGLHVESLTRNESTCACPARSYWAMTSMHERKSKGCASVPKLFYFLKWIYKVVVNF